MSQETRIDSLSGGISEEDAKLVDSILNDLGQGPSQQQPPQEVPMQQPQAQQPSVQQAPMQQPAQAPSQQQMMAQQQAIAQQQMMAQQMMAQQGAMQQGAAQQVGSQPSGIAESIKRETKSIMVIIFLSIMMNLGQIDSLFKKIGMFVDESGVLNMQCVFVKALLIGGLFFAIKTQLL